MVTRAAVLLAPAVLPSRSSEVMPPFGGGHPRLDPRNEAGPTGVPEVMKSAVIVLLLAIFSSSCGAPASSGAASHSRSASPSVIPSASASVVAAGTSVLLVIEAPVPTPGSAVSLQLIREDGTAMRTVNLSPGSDVVAVAGQRIFVRTTDGGLLAIAADGHTKQLEPAGLLTGIGGVAASPDGSRWLWASQTSDTTSQSIYVAGDGLAARKIATLAYPTVLVPYAWTSHGIFFDSLPMDYFGYRPFNTVFNALGGVQLLDPATGTMKPLTLHGCVFSDETADGEIACFPTDAGYLVPNRHTLRIIDPSGKSNDFVLSIPRFNNVGDAFFSRDATFLTVAGATGVAAPLQIGATSTKSEQYGTDLVTVSAAQIVRFGPMGTRLAMGSASWLPDGKLVLWRPDDYGGAAGLYVTDPHGGSVGSEIVVLGRPVGYLNG